MTRVTVHEYAATLRPRYRAARRRDKGKILDEFCQTTGLHRKAAIRLLGEESRPKAVGRGRPRKYGPEVEAPLLRVWEMGDRMCGKLLVAVMPDLLAALERHGELKVSAGVRGQLLSMSSSTCDRLLRKQHRRLSVLPPAHKAPAATSLKSEIPLKTWSEWADVKPGSLQADLVVHSGESAAGFFLNYADHHRHRLRLDRAPAGLGQGHDAGGLGGPLRPGEAALSSRCSPYRQRL